MPVKEMLINAIDDEECRIAVVADGELEELYVERASTEYHVGNIYKGRVTNIEPSIQAAFVDYGAPKNGFLHVSDVAPSYFPEHLRDRGGMKPPIQNILKRGQEVIIQVTKEGIGTKGPSMTTYLSIPGRYLVLMPGFNRIGVSRKIEDEEERRQLREALEGLERPKNMGVIIRTAGLNQPKGELRRDLRYLNRVWAMLCDRIRSAKAPAEIFRESDLVVRAIRDVFTTDIERILVDDEEVARRVKEFLRIAMPRYVSRVMLYEDKEPLYYKYGLDEEIEKVYTRTVPLPCGGYLVIDQTEALVAIDVNSGKFRHEHDPEESAYRLNLEAAQEIARQLRLRDLGGVIVMDFVDMRLDRHRRAVEDKFRNELKRDRARSRFLRTSKFGLIEMTRQRMRPSIERATFMDCPYCKGSGLVKTPESMSLEAMRQIALAASRDDIHQIEVTVHPHVAQFIHNRKRRALVHLEERSGKPIMVIADPRAGHESVTFNCVDNRAICVKFDPREMAHQQRQKVLQQQVRERPAGKPVPHRPKAVEPSRRADKGPPSAGPQAKTHKPDGKPQDGAVPEQTLAGKAPPAPGPQQQPIHAPAGAGASGQPQTRERPRKRRRRGRRGGVRHRKRRQRQAASTGEPRTTPPQGASEPAVAETQGRPAGGARESRSPPAS